MVSRRKNLRRNIFHQLFLRLQRRFGIRHQADTVSHPEYAFAMAAGSVEEIYELIKSISYPNNKSKHLSAMAKKLAEDFNGVVPDDMELLQTPQIIKVAVPHPQHSPWLGHMPLVQIVCKLCPRTTFSTSTESWPLGEEVGRGF